MPSKELIPRPAEPLAVIAAPPWEQPKKMETASTLRLGWRAVRRNSHLSVPLFAPPALWLAALILNLTHVVLYAALAGAVLAVCVWFFAPHKWDRPAEQWYARLSAILGAGWLVIAAWLGPVRGMPGLVLACVLFVGCCAWGWFWWQHKRPRGQRKRDALIARWDAWWQSHCWHWNLGGSAIVNVWTMGVTVKVEVAGLAGRHSIQYVNQVLHLIESGLDGMVDVGRVRAETVKGRPNHWYLYFKQANPLAEIVEWDPSIAPKSVHDPAPTGLTETGSWKMSSLRTHAFVIGATDTGKSNHLLVRFASLSGCPDDLQVIVDLKGGRSARPALQTAAAEYVITDVDEARMYLLMLVTEISARNKYAYDGHEQLHATVEVPALHTLFDEVHGLTSVTNGDAECSRHLATCASQGRGVEIYAEVYTQYGSLEESVRTEQTRGNLRLRVVYRVEMAAHGQFAIEEWNKLDASKLEEKGTCYIKDGPKALAEQVRAPHMPHSLLLRITAQNAALIGDRPALGLYCGSEPCPAGGTWQEWWDRRWLRLDPAFHSISPQYQAAVAEFGDQPAPAPAHAPDLIAPPPAAEPGTGDGRAAAARIDAELDAVRVPDGWHPPKIDLRPVLARQRAAFGDALAAAQERDGITPRQLAAESGMSTSWIHPMLTALAEKGAIAQLKRGLYVPAPGADVHEAMALVEADRKRLLGQARHKISNAA